MNSHIKDPIETEVKFFIPETASLRDRIAALGGVFRGRVFEKNLRLDTKENQLKNNASLLRLRRDDKTTLTFKSKPPFESSQFKVFTEYEVTVSDFDTMKIILESLGYHGVQMYEKWRETFLFDETWVLIDAMPYGDFMEIEGRPEAIKNLANSLGMNWNQRILLNYLAIFDIIKTKMNLPFHDVTFDNFSPHRVRIADFLPLLYPDESR